MRIAAFALGMAVSNAWAFQCPQDQSLATKVAESERIFVAYVTETRLEVDLLNRLIEKYPEQMTDPDTVKLLSAGYRIVEDLKGSAAYTPRLLDMLGIGTGYVGLTPGVYYLVFLGALDPEDQLDSADLRRVDICSVPVSHYRVQVAEFQAQVSEVRSLIRGSN